MDRRKAEEAVALLGLVTVLVSPRARTGQIITEIETSMRGGRLKGLVDDLASGKPTVRSSRP